jgi:crotonobetainyl-CoA:carnitine CoA-transferase CaiB-like acyl-CoA transferase
MSITGPDENVQKENELNQPYKVGVAITDVMTGLYSTVGIFIY